MAPVSESRGGAVARPAVLELGEDIGAAVIYAEERHDGAELEIKPHAAEWNGDHTEIRRRCGRGPHDEAIYAALFYGLRAGRYELRLRGKPFGESQAIDVVGGRIAELDLIG